MDIPGSRCRSRGLVSSVDASGEAERTGAGLIVVGSRSLGAYAELLLGSVSRKVLHLAKVPVMVVQA